MLPFRIVSLFFCLFPALAFAQGKVNGKLTDNKKNKLGYATVTLLRPDSTVVNGSLSDDNGNFELENIPYGNYILRINALGVSTMFIGDVNLSEGKPVKNLGTVTLALSSKALDEVEITGEKSVMQMQVDKKVFNVDKNITTAGGSASEVLSNVPSVSVDVDGSVSLRGKGNVTILIDGKPATMLGGDVATALQSLPASSIDNVEIITNPGAKYDAQGITGIINIVTKRDRKFGINGSVNAGAGTGDKYNGGLNLNAKNEKWNVFFNSNYRNNKNYNRHSNERYNFRPDGSLSDTSYAGYESGNRQWIGWFNSLGAEYIINKYNSITLTQNINYMRWGNKGTSDFWMLVNGDTIPQRSRSSVSKGGPLSSSTTLDYKHKFKREKQELTGNLNYVKSWATHKQEYNTYDAFSLQDHTFMSSLYEDAPSKGSNSSINAQADFTTPFISKNGKLDAGWKTQVFNFQSANEPIIRNNKTFVDSFNSVLYNEYEYGQQTHAAYTSFSDQLGQFSYQAGLRLEYTNYDGDVRRGDTMQPFYHYNNEFLNLFPSAFLSYKLPQDQNIFLNFSRRINRPSFWNLMPYVDLSNPQDTSMGNPGLKPEFIYSTELSYNKPFKKGHNLMVSAYYQHTTGMIERYRRFYADGTTFSQPQNLATGLTYGMELIGRAQILPIWDATLNLNFFHNNVRGGNIAPELNNSGTAWFAKANTNLKLPAGFSLQLNGNYEAPKVLAQGYLSEVYWIDIALRKNMLKNKATLVLNVSDILNTRKYTTAYEYPTYYQNTYRDRETRIGNISFTYRFGSDKQPGMPQGASAVNGNKRKGREKKEEKPAEKDRNNLKSDESEGGGQSK
jgi:outer membrane receptor protein involved in Fe transport